MRFLYLCLTCLYVVPLGIVILLRALLGRGRDLERLGFGLPHRDSAEPLIWFVASSVGEVGVALKLIGQLKRSGGPQVALTVTTPAGRAQARSQSSGIDYLLYHPFDTPCIVRRFLERLRPTTLVMVETELWPSLLSAAISRKVRLLQVAGRLSSKSVVNYKSFRSLFAPLLRSYDSILVQSEKDAEHFVQLGAPPDVVRVMGSPKEEYSAPGEAELAPLRELLSAWSARQVFIAGSTRPGEEEIILEAFRQARQTLPDLRLILAPRHLKRSAEVVSLLENSGLHWCKRSSGAVATEDDILLLDTIGELNTLYHLADLAFVGGTLAPLGGHNLLEPALAGVPVLHGPHYFDQNVGAESLHRHQLGKVVRNSQDMAAAIVGELQHGSPRARVASQVEELRSASADIVDAYVKEILRT